MKKNLVWIGVLLVILQSGFASFSHAKQSQKNSCITCHTDDMTLKKLFTPPKTQASEGEG